MNLLTVDDLGLKYGDRSVFHRINFRLARGEKVGLAGVSGSGKSSFLRLLAGLEQPSSGVVLWDGENPLQLARAERQGRRRHIQLMLQDSAGALSPRRTIEQTLHEPLLTHTNHDRKARSGLVRQWMENVGLCESMLERYPHQLSGGERQRIALARTLIIQPNILLADEPVSALDSVSKLEILQLIKKLQQEQGFGLLLVGHDLGVLRSACSRQWHLCDGGLVAIP